MAATEIDSTVMAAQKRRSEVLGDLRRRLLDAGNAMERAHRDAVCGRTPDLSALYGAIDAVRRAEEALDLADFDVRTASGEDA